MKAEKDVPQADLEAGALRQDPEQAETERIGLEFLQRAGYTIADPADWTQREVAIAADRLLFLRNQVAAEVADLVAVAATRIEDIRRWQAEASAVRQRTLEYLEGQLYRVALAMDLTRGKTLSVPQGKIGWRRRRARVEIDDQDAAVQFAEERGLPVKVEKSAQKTPLLDFVLTMCQEGWEYVPHENALVNESTGEILELHGFRYDDSQPGGGRGEFFIRPADAE